MTEWTEGNVKLTKTQERIISWLPWPKRTVTTAEYTDVVITTEIK